MNTKRWLLLILVVFLASSVVYGEADIGYLYDSRDYAMVEIVTSTDIAKDLRFWGFTDIYGKQGTKKALQLSEHFMEYRLDYAIIPTENKCRHTNIFEVEIEYNGFSGDSNDLIRGGVSFTKTVFGKGFVQLRYHPYDSRGIRFSQTSITHLFPITRKLAFFGFYDYNMNSEGHNIWYYEPALTYAVNSKYLLTLIYRWDGFANRIRGQKGAGIALGIYRKI